MKFVPVLMLISCGTSPICTATRWSPNCANDHSSPTGTLYAPPVVRLTSIQPPMPYLNSPVLVPAYICHTPSEVRAENRPTHGPGNGVPPANGSSEGIGR